MRTYEDFLLFLEEHLKSIKEFIPTSDKDFHPICFALARFLLSEPYRWTALMENWPTLPEVQQPEKNAVLEFFQAHKGLPLSFRKELQEDDYATLEAAYKFLFPILITKDEFLTAIFRQDIHSRRYKKIFKEREKKIARIIEKLNSFKRNPSFIELMTKFTSDLAGFSLTLINNKKLTDKVVDSLASGK